MSASSSTSTGLYASSGSGLAGYFQGPVFIQGSYTATGAKSAAVPHPDGSHRRLYCLESPESYFEDFGRGQLVNGRTDVRLDRDFAAVVRAEDYDVFLTPKGDTKGLYVSSQGPASFEVREQQGGTSSVPFSYRVVAKRKDISGPRMERVAVPSAAEHRRLAPMAPPPPPAAEAPRPAPPSERR